MYTNTSSHSYSQNSYALDCTYPISLNIFDLDNTLVYTDKLNTKAYNYALTSVGLDEISNITRITKEVVLDCYPNLSNDAIREISNIKKSYFIENLDNLSLNFSLVNMLMSTSGSNVIYTAADPNRALAILNYFELMPYIDNIFFFDKKDPATEVAYIMDCCNTTKTNTYIYDDNINVVATLQKANNHVSFPSL